ncbi:MAG: hypothetical protein ACON4N_01745 [Myxococcota bacterium]
MRQMWLGALLVCACDGGSSSGQPTEEDDTLEVSETDTVVDGDTDGSDRPPVHVVVMTHIEDTTPGGSLEAPGARPQYLEVRSALLQTAALMQGEGLTWVLQPDWKVLEAALLFEDKALMSNTGGMNVFAHLHDALGVRLDPHSHETQGYNYTDVAHLLDVLGAGGSTVMGGHIWDPELDLFQRWDRYRAPEAGGRYPKATWQAEILIGAGTPNHTNDPLVSGLWRPQDRDHFFEHDEGANLISIGSGIRLYDVDRDDRPAAFVEAVTALVADQAEGATPAGQVVTAYLNVGYEYLRTAASREDLQTEMLAPLAALQASGDIVVTDFQDIATVWQAHGAAGELYEP